MEAANIASYNRFTFSFEERVIEEIDSKEYCEIYSNIVVLESENPKFPVGTKVEQLTVSTSFYFERNDGTEY
jgi:hypothetical protein